MATKRLDPVLALQRLAKNIRSRRLELNLTQESVAGDAGISVGHYQKLESGSVDVRYTSLHAVADALRTTVGELN